MLNWALSPSAANMLTFCMKNRQQVGLTTPVDREKHNMQFNSSRLVDKKKSEENRCSSISTSKAASLQEEMVLMLGRFY